MVDEITKYEFLRYEEVRRSCRYNMMFHQLYASIAAGLSMEKYTEIQKNYKELAKKYLNEEVQ